MNGEPAIQLWLSFGRKGEPVCAGPGTESPWQEVQLMERFVAHENMVKAYKHVVSNGGSPGVDGMTVQELGVYLHEHWHDLMEALLAGTYAPHPFYG